MTQQSDHSSEVRERLEAAGLRATPKRVALGRLVLAGPPRHITAEELWRDAHDAGVDVSLATVYNTLNGFLDAGLLRPVEASGSRSLFDTNTEPHHHVLDMRTGVITDLPIEAIDLMIRDGALPAGARVEGIAVMVRVRSD